MSPPLSWPQLRGFPMGEKDKGRDFDQRMVKALAHPLRVEILRQLEGGPSSPKRLADRTGEQLGNVS